MKLIRLLAAGVSPALLTALLLFGSACIVDQGEPIDDVDETAEADDMLYGTPDHVDAFGEGYGTEDDVPDDADEMDGWSDEREEQQIVLPGVMVSEPEPDPWDDPMKNGHDSGSGNKD